MCSPSTNIARAVTRMWARMVAPGGRLPSAHGTVFPDRKRSASIAIRLHPVDPYTARGGLAGKAGIDLQHLETPFVKDYFHIHQAREPYGLGNFYGQRLDFKNLPGSQSARCRHRLAVVNGVHKQLGNLKGHIAARLTDHFQGKGRSVEILLETPTPLGGTRAENRASASLSFFRRTTPWLPLAQLGLATTGNPHWGHGSGTENT